MRHPGPLGEVGDWQAVEAAMVGFGLVHCGAQCNGREGAGGIPH
jgi:hypothetical protein